jgi:DNA-binding NarL/FixJ family response regulator
MPGATVRVLLVDDHHLFRGGLADLLGGEPGIEVAGHAPSGREGVRLAGALAPDVTLMDLSMPGDLDGTAACRAIVAADPDARVVILTVSGDDRSVGEAILGGACGYVLKDAPVDEVVAAVRAAAVGEAWISQRVAASLLGRLRDGPAGEPEPAPEDELPDLSPRELQVLRLIARGADNGAIAAELGISPKTAKNHVASILAKLQLENRVQAAVYAVRRGLD